MKKMTDRQKARLYQQRRNGNYQESKRIQGFYVKLVTLTAEEALRRIDELRSHYER